VRNYAREDTRMSSVFHGGVQRKRQRMCMPLHWGPQLSPPWRNYCSVLREPLPAVSCVPFPRSFSLRVSDCNSSASCPESSGPGWFALHRISALRVHPQPGPKHIKSQCRTEACSFCPLCKLTFSMTEVYEGRDSLRIATTENFPNHDQ
jgi:hypothetical protein